MSNKVLIILGMHRSGTSLTTQWIQKCGVKIGERLMSANFSNKDGHFEDLDFHDLHEEIFRNHNIPYGGFENIVNFQLTEGEIDKINKLIVSKNLQNTQWGWKDPRTCLFMEYYLKLIPDVKIILIIRNYFASVNSLINRTVMFKKQRILNSGRLGYLRLLLYKIKKEKKEKKKLGNLYSDAAIIYYKNILKTIQNVNKDNIIVVNFNNIVQQHKNIYNKLLSWGFNVSNIPINKVFKENYIHAKTKSNYIPKEKQTILKKLENEIQYYIINL